MPPRKRNDTTRRLSAGELANRRLQRKVAAFLEFDPAELESRVKDVARQFQDANRRASLEAEALLLFIELRGRNFKEKPCKWCKQDFLHTTTFVAFCCDECRYMALKAEGIPWNPDAKSDVERWDNRMPLVIGPYATERAHTWLEYNPEQLAIPKEFWPHPPLTAEEEAQEEVDNILKELGIN